MYKKLYKLLSKCYHFITRTNYDSDVVMINGESHHLTDTEVNEYFVRGKENGVKVSYPVHFVDTVTIYK